MVPAPRGAQALVEAENGRADAARRLAATREVGAQPAPGIVDLLSELVGCYEARVADARRLAQLEEAMARAGMGGNQPV